MTIRESMEKEMNIYAMYCENTVETAISMGEIQMYTESAWDTIKETTERIIQAIRDFIKKTKDLFALKLKEFKLKHDMNKLRKNLQKGINNIATITDYTEEKEIRKMYDKFVKECIKSIDKIRRAKSDAEVRSIEGQVEGLVLQYEKEIATKSKTLRIKLTDNPEKMLEVDQIMTYIDNASENCVNECSNLAKTFEAELKKQKEDEKEAAEKAELKKKKIALCQKIQQKISSACTKAGNFVVKNKTKLLAAFGIAAAATGVGVGVHHYRNSDE